jgi:hypothetical protein
MNTLHATNGWRLVVLCGLLVMPVRGWAQSAATGTIAGVVKDATGAVLSQASRWKRRVPR